VERKRRPTWGPKSWRIVLKAENSGIQGGGPECKCETDPPVEIEVEEQVEVDTGGETVAGIRTQLWVRYFQSDGLVVQIRRELERRGYAKREWNFLGLYNPVNNSFMIDASEGAVVDNQVPLRAVFLVAQYL